MLGNSLVDRVGRRVLLLCSIACMIVSQSLLALGIGLQIAPLAALSLYLVVASFAPGFGPLPFLLNTELFSTAAVGASSSYSLGANWLGTFLIAVGFLPLQKAIGTWVFMVFIVSLLISSMVIYFYLPETRGRSIKNIGPSQVDD